mmetsp:Transcript_9558/g.17747  ORF Transcript_9558/g.17747 Transcript_9558/m.17747 type:complete len:385 (-) Transcript_9558:131-1285(-)
MVSVPQGAERQLWDFNLVHEQRKLPYYDTLGISTHASKAEIVRAYRRLSLRLHPDKPGGSSEQFQQLSRAYTCLSNEERRRKYDDCGFDEDNIADSKEVDEFVDAFFGEGARNVDGRSPDWNTGKVENYVRVDLADVPLHMRDIVRIGLKYIVSLEQSFENVILLQHARVDILYLMVGMVHDIILTQEVFESEVAYTITYYDNPLQPGIAPRWSDQNRLTGRALKPGLPRRELNQEEFQRRQKHALAMLQNGPADPLAALEEKYRTRMLAKQHATTIAGKTWASLQEQDVYEEDAELDCTTYAGVISQNRVFECTPEAAAGKTQEEASDFDSQTLRNTTCSGGKSKPWDKLPLQSSALYRLSCSHGCFPIELLRRLPFFQPCDS